MPCFNHSQFGVTHRQIALPEGVARVRFRQPVENRQAVTVGFQRLRQVRPVLPIGPRFLYTRFPTACASALFRQANRYGRRNGFYRIARPDSVKRDLHVVGYRHADGPSRNHQGFARYFGTPLNGAVYVVAVAVDEVRLPIVLSVVTLVTVTLVTSRKEDLSYSAP